MEIISNTATVVDAAAETATAVVETAQQANAVKELLQRATSVAKAHPVGAVAVGSIAAAGALYGAYKLSRKLLSKRSTKKADKDAK